MRGITDQISIIFAEEFRRNLRRRSYQILTLAAPVILIILVIAVPIIRNIAEGGEDEGQDGKPIGALNLSADLSLQDIAFPGIRIFQDRDSGIAALTNDEIEDFFIIEANYLQSGRVDWLYQSNTFIPDESNADVMRAALRITLAGNQLSPEQAARVLNPADFDRVRIGESGEPSEENDGSKFLISFVFGMMLMLGIIWGGSALMSSVSEEKETRVVEIILTSSQPLSIMAGKVLALGAAGLIQLVVWVGSVAIIGPRIFDQIPAADELSIDVSLMAVVMAFFITGYFIYAFLMAAIGAATTSTREASQVSTLVTLPGFIPVWFIQIILESPDGVFARVLSFFPLTAPVAMMVRLAATDVSPLEIVAVLAVLLISCLALLWVSARIFRAGLLLYGQRMSLGGVWNALREAG